MLFLVGSPIGNLSDITLRALEVLKEVTLVATEDTRRSSILLRRFEISKPLVSFHEHNEDARASELVERMCAGAAVALVADAGTPVIADPGFALVARALAADVPVEVLPGPSAVLTALVASGLPAPSPSGRATMFEPGLLRPSPWFRRSMCPLFAPTRQTARSGMGAGSRRGE